MIRIAINEYFGWQRIDPFKVGRDNVDWAVWQLGNKRASLLTDTLPNYPEDIREAVKLPAHLAGHGWKCELFNGLDTSWECIFWRPKQGDTKQENTTKRDGGWVEEHYGAADDLAGAICIAFLKTLSLWPE